MYESQYFGGRRSWKEWFSDGNNLSPFVVFSREFIWVKSLNYFNLITNQSWWIKSLPYFEYIPRMQIIELKWREESEVIQVAVCCVTGPTYHRATLSAGRSIPLGRPQVAAPVLCHGRWLTSWKQNWPPSIFIPNSFQSRNVRLLQQPQLPSYNLFEFSFPSHFGAKKWNCFHQITKRFELIFKFDTFIHFWIKMQNCFPWKLPPPFKRQVKIWKKAREIVTRLH